MKNIISKLKEQNMLYFALASLISSDSNNSIEEINNMKALQFFKNMIFEANLEQEEKENLLKICDDGFEILSKDLLTFGGK